MVLTKNRTLNQRDYTILALASLAAVCVYLFVSQYVYRIGFPLDDAWIHQTYARNLANGSGWVFTPGNVSAGSTSPLWTILLAIGHLIKLGPYIWTFFLGWLLLGLISILGESTVRFLIPDWHPKLPWIGLLLVFEWHLVWAAVSGMETLLFAFGITLILCLLIRGDTHWLSLGVLSGILVWVRPDGITLLGPVGLMACLQNAGMAQHLKDMLRVAGGALAAIVPYLLFNFTTGGTIWPSTFYAKQTEYAVYQQIPYLSRLGSEISVPMVGVGILLLPGLIYLLVQGMKNRQWVLMASIIWWVSFLGIYAWKLPVTYQHGRYVMPVIPIYVILGTSGLVTWVRSHVEKPWQRIIGKTAVLACSIVTLMFWGIVSVRYATEVAIIETEMVEPAQWLYVNSKPDDLIAAHDIGAVGYFCPRKIVDLAGLVSPEVIPALGNEEKIKLLMDQAGVNHLILTFDWYSGLRAGREIEYCSTGSFASAQSEQNTCVYRWGD